MGIKIRTMSKKTMQNPACISEENENSQENMSGTCSRKDLKLTANQECLTMGQI